MSFKQYSDLLSLLSVLAEDHPVRAQEEEAKAEQTVRRVIVAHGSLSKYLLNK